MRGSILNDPPGCLATNGLIHDEFPTALRGMMTKIRPTAGTKEYHEVGPMIAFGPVPSRHLGRSLGINNIPPKECTYSRVYCQLGRTGKMRIRRRAFHAPEEILEAVQDKVQKAGEKGEMEYSTLRRHTG